MMNMFLLCLKTFIRRSDAITCSILFPSATLSRDDVPPAHGVFLCFSVCVCVCVCACVCFSHPISLFFLIQMTCWTPLFFAAARGYHECASLLIDNGADVNSTDYVSYDETTTVHDWYLHAMKMLLLYSKILVKLDIRNPFLSPSSTCFYLFFAPHAIVLTASRFHSSALGRPPRS